MMKTDSQSHQPDVQSLATQTQYSVEDLISILSLLRSEQGCPWDRAQTHSSIRRNLIEEAYELAEALDKDDASMIQEEMGDLLLQIVFHACMEEEQGRSRFSDAVTAVCRKLVFRHPHIFGGDNRVSAEEALSRWDEMKQIEKKQENCTSTLKAVAKTLPSLMRSQKLIKKAKKAGLYQPITEKTTPGYPQPEDLINRLFALCEEANELDLDLEEALYFKNEQFIQEISEREKVQ